MDKEDISLINEIKESKDSRVVDQAIKELTDRHSGIFINMVKRYVPPHADFCDSHEDIRSELPSFVWETALEYDPGRGMKFSTYLGQRARWKFCKQNKHHAVSNIEDTVEFFDGYIADQPDGDSETDFEMLSLVNKEIDNLPDGVAKDIMKLRYESGDKVLSWWDVGEKLGRSHQNCIDIHNSTVKQITERLFSVGIS